MFVAPSLDPVLSPIFAPSPPSTPAPSVIQPPSPVAAPPPPALPPSPPPPRDAVLHVSNLAAAARAAEPEPEATRASAPAVVAAAPEAAIASVEGVDLVWFDRASLPRVRKKPEWRAIVQALEDRPPDPELDDVTLGSSPAEIEDRRDVFEILARGSPVDTAGVEEALAAAVRNDGKLVPPLVLASGTLTFPFDEIEVLRAHVALITPLSTGDEKLRAEIALVKDYLSTPDFALAPQMVDALSGRVWDAFNRSKHAVAAETLRAHAEAGLLQKRRLQRREVFGGGHLRALFQSGAEHVPAYLPAALSSALPMFVQFRARLLAEAHLPVDQHETAPAALRVVALARLWQRAPAG
jgi:hypothetical protein